MKNTPFFKLYPFTLGTLLLCQLLQGEETLPPEPIASYSYLSSLELKLEEMRHQLKTHQKESDKVISGLLQIKTVMEEIHTIRDALDQTSAKRYLELMSLMDSFHQEKETLLELHQTHLKERESLLKAQADLLSHLDQKANMQEVSLSLNVIKNQLSHVGEHLKTKASLEDFSSLQELLSQNTLSLNLLENNFSLLTQTQQQVSHIETLYNTVLHQTDTLSQKLERVENSSLEHRNSLAALEIQQQKLSKKEVPPLPEKGSRFYAELLYFQTLEPDMHYTSTSSTVQVLQEGMFNPLSQLTFSPITFRWDPGYRVGMGYRSGIDSWDFSSEYTYFRNENTQKSKDFVKAALTYNVWDVTVQHPFHATSSTLMQFLMGVRSSFIHQNWNLLASAQSIPTNNLWKMSGVGPRAGINLDWMWSEHFGAHFQTTGGLILGWVNRQQQAIISSSTAVNGLIQNDPVRELLIPNLEMIAGLKWQQRLESMTLNVFANWEFNEWVNLNKNYVLPLSANLEGINPYQTTSLSLQGLSFGMGVDF
ncbi:Lpg1974 family pore-forming outer membrane protein [Rhabdochlamydiaceae symbiont of Dictyostelium giganteum]|uniref:Lpg1974 family pore-forming outer membrane protein n=1 Tax=Rhabdochlamydiaceae symbiont of Dictyostelium giganteum TaxID=3342349 RepID=UPI00384B9E94